MARRPEQDGSNGPNLPHSQPRLRESSLATRMAEHCPISLSLDPPLARPSNLGSGSIEIIGAIDRFSGLPT